MKTTHCATCGQSTDKTFCSQRCQMIDLGSWLSGRYAIPAEQGDDENGEFGSDHTDPKSSGNGENGPSRNEW
ncbi:MAG: DNA gyrase inhibitor YacG [Myxococcota bacterium]